MNKKRLGIIGGMGPDATQFFYKKIIDSTLALCDQDHLDMIILNHASMPDRTMAIAENKISEMTACFVEDLRLLEQCGASCIAIPCNTAHVIIKELQRQTSIPIVDMIQETVTLLEERCEPNAKIGILATDGTIKAGMYFSAIKQRNFTPVIPENMIQRKVMEIIYNGVKGGGKICINEIQAIENFFIQENCACVILACTELSFLKNKFFQSDYYIDAMDALTKKVIVLCDKPIK